MHPKHTRNLQKYVILMTKGRTALSAGRGEWQKTAAQQKVLASAEGVQQLTLAVLGSWSAASPAPSTFCLLLCPSTRLSASALAAGLLAAFLTADAKTGTRWVCLFNLNPSDRMSLFRWIASIGIRMMGFSILTCKCNRKLMQAQLRRWGDCQTNAA